MARISQDELSGKTGSNDQKTTEIDASGQNSVEVPNSEFISNSEISRDGQDLVLETPQGETLVIQNYFNAEQSPLLESPDGSILTESLVNSFLNSSPQYAQTDSMTDESPVGAIEEIKGEANVTRADGSTEPLTLGSPIFTGDVIETSEEGAVNIVFIDETSMAVSNNARMSIDEYQFDPSTESGETNLSVLRGVFVFTSGLIGRDDPDDVLIDTPVGSIGIRGTIIAGNINPGGESEITVVEGAIVVKNAVMETTLSEQYESVKLGGINDNIEDIGIKSADKIGETYGSVTDVVPKLFSSINDTAKEEIADQKDADIQADSDEIIEEIIEEEVKVEPEVEPMIEDPTLDPLMQENIFDAPLQNPSLLPEDIDSTDLTFKQVMRIRDIRDADLETIDPSIFKDLPLELRAGASQLFEGKNAGDVVGRFFVDGGALGAKTFTFGNLTTTSSDTYFNIVQVAPNVVEIRLTTAGAGAIPGVGAALGSGFDILATDSAGQQSALSITNTNVLDAVVNLNTFGGLNYHSHATAPPSSLKEIGDVNGDGVNDSVRVNGPNVEIIDGSTSSPLLTQAGSSIAGIGDIDNDGYYDVITGNPTGGSGNGEYQLFNGFLGAQTAVPGATIGDMVGHSVTGLGDFDGDGRSDYAVGAPGAGTGGVVLLELSGGNPVINGQAGENAGQFISYLGNINGTLDGGHSDLMVGTAATIGNQAYIFYGGTSPTNTAGADITIQAGGAHTIIAGGVAGDINGDGYDDFAISLDGGAGDINTYVVYGSNSIPGTINVNWLENPDHALKLNHAGAGGNPYEISALGDINGDGFDDINVGIIGGGHYTVYGGLGGNAPYVTDNNSGGNDNDATVGIVEASGPGQALVGNVDFNDGNLAGLSMRGGDGQNTFDIQRTDFKNIDGGDGIDTIRNTGNINFTNVNFEQISQIEQIEFGQDTSTITLTAENIFNLLKSSDNGELRIDLGAVASGNLTITDLDGVTGATIDAQIINVLNEEGAGAANYNGINVDGNMHFDIGGYNLYIDASIGTAVV